MHAGVRRRSFSIIGFNIIKKLEWPNENIKKLRLSSRTDATPLFNFLKTKSYYYELSHICDTRITDEHIVIVLHICNILCDLDSGGFIYGIHLHRNNHIKMHVD